MKKIYLGLVIGLAVLINLFFIIILMAKLARITLLESVYYFTDICSEQTVNTSDNKVVFKLFDGTGQPLGCKKMKLEEEVACTESPCPDFNVIKRIKTTKDGTIVVPKDIFNNLVYDTLDRKILPQENKQFLFHVEGNYNATTSFTDIINLSSTMNLILEEKSKEFCDDPRFRKNDCDGY